MEVAEEQTRDVQSSLELLLNQLEVSRETDVFSITADSEDLQLGGEVEVRDVSEVTTGKSHRDGEEAGEEDAVVQGGAEFVLAEDDAIGMEVEVTRKSSCSSEFGSPSGIEPHGTDLSAESIIVGVWGGGGVMEQEVVIVEEDHLEQEQNTNERETYVPDLSSSEETNLQQSPDKETGVDVLDTLNRGGGPTTPEHQDAVEDNLTESSPLQTNPSDDGPVEERRPNQWIPRKQPFIPPMTEWRDFPESQDLLLQLDRLPDNNHRETGDMEEEEKEEEEVEEEEEEGERRVEEEDGRGVGESVEHPAEVMGGTVEEDKEETEINVESQIIMEEERKEEEEKEEHKEEEEEIEVTDETVRETDVVLRESERITDGVEEVTEREEKEEEEEEDRTPTEEDVEKEKIDEKEEEEEEEGVVEEEEGQRYEKDDEEVVNGENMKDEKDMEIITEDEMVDVEDGEEIEIPPPQVLESTEYSINQTSTEQPSQLELFLPTHSHLYHCPPPPPSPPPHHHHSTVPDSSPDGGLEIAELFMRRESDLLRRAKWFPRSKPVKTSVSKTDDNNTVIPTSSGNRETPVITAPPRPTSSSTTLAQALMPPVSIKTQASPSVAPTTATSTTTKATSATTTTTSATTTTSSSLTAVQMATNILAKALSISTTLSSNNKTSRTVIDPRHRMTVSRPQTAHSPPPPPPPLPAHPTDHPSIPTLTTSRTADNQRLAVSTTAGNERLRVHTSMVAPPHTEDRRQDGRVNERKRRRTEEEEEVVDSSFFNHKSQLVKTQEREEAVTLSSPQSQNRTSQQQKDSQNPPQHQDNFRKTSQLQDKTSQHQDNFQKTPQHQDKPPQHQDKTPQLQDNFQKTSQHQDTSEDDILVIEESQPSTSSDEHTAPANPTAIIIPTPSGRECEKEIEEVRLQHTETVKSLPPPAQPSCSGIHTVASQSGSSELEGLTPIEEDGVRGSVVSPSIERGRVTRERNRTKKVVFADRLEHQNTETMAVMRRKRKMPQMKDFRVKLRKISPLPRPPQSPPCLFPLASNNKHTPPLPHSLLPLPPHPHSYDPWNNISDFLLSCPRTTERRTTSSITSRKRKRVSGSPLPSLFPLQSEPTAGLSETAVPLSGQEIMDKIDAVLLKDIHGGDRRKVKRGGGGGEEEVKHRFVNRTRTNPRNTAISHHRTTSRSERHMNEPGPSSQNQPVTSHHHHLQHTFWPPPPQPPHVKKIVHRFWFRYTLVTLPLTNMPS